LNADRAPQLKAIVGSKGNFYPQEEGTTVTREDAENLFWLANKALLINDSAGADDLLSQVIADYDDCAGHLAYRSFVHTLEDRLPEALADAERAFSMAPSMLEARDALAFSYFCLARFEEAVNTFINIPGEPFDDEGHFYHLLAYSLLAENIVSGADSEAPSAFKFTPISRAAFCILTGDPAAGGRELKDAEDGLLFYTTSALAFYRMGKYQDAADLLRLAMRMCDQMFPTDGLKLLRSYLAMYARAGARAKLSQTVAS
jgi:tetratricopeptide (TPR) repeat protein